MIRLSGLRFPRNVFGSSTRRYAHITSYRRLPTRNLIWGTVGATLAISVALAFSDTVRLDSNITPQDDPETTTDPATGIRFPKTVKVASKVPLPILSLVGVGVRTVSFLRVQVYSVAFYADLDNPNLKLDPSMTPDEKIQEIVKTCACEIRIVPTRSTSYSHLRDAFIRAITTRLSVSRKNGTLTDEQAFEAASPIRKLKTLFPNTALSKHSPLDIFLYPPIPGKPRVLIFRDLGSIESDWVATEFVLHYFEGEGPSPPLKKMVVETVQSLQK
ncbi:chalcone-flavanone isomerase-domain-containing protein [Rhodocollybia butyracea]|uniref:Chalcone-flavanone isomerase-domain-containing protein n=1 Tax=Rhodocollybia butyracea TaxID=206335 RepID=A0A9P5PWK4_9AGAR|nr:chalcone-flavanone isomerase-domain-containing protein [Rhodocollybia butyracea]